MKKSCLKLLPLGLMLSLAACSTMTTPTTTSSMTAAETAAQAAGAAVPPDESQPGTPEVQNSGTAGISDAGIGGTAIGGAVEQAMDTTDKTKMLRAMDKAPGKSTHWTNKHTDIAYTVTPIRKIKIQDKPYCRQYQVTAVNSNNQEKTVQGVACIATDGNWHIYNN